MPDEKTLSLNGGEESSPSGNAQPENNAPVSELDDDIDAEIDSILAKGSEDDDDDDEDTDDDDTVVLSKKQVERLKNNLENYSKALKSIKGRIKASKDSKANSSKDSKKTISDDNAPVTKADIRKGYEREAINTACQDAEVEKNWAEIVKFYTPRHGKDSVASQVKNIQEAHYLWGKDQEDNGDDDEEVDDKKTTAQLAAEKSKPNGSASKGKEVKGAKHIIIPQREKVQDWYPDPGKK